MNLLLLLLVTQIHGPFQVVKQGSNVYLVPQGIIKTGPRSFSMADPRNPYREQPSSVVATPVRNQPRVFPNLQPTGGTVIIWNPFLEPKRP